ncbi:hypothetical protein EVAR_94140_1 [Eumeta japonica]|uniref:Uncharacterized protein n=1 Tax=Eumeta variegata TaxID=151549 RepID=A0A4C1U760_EUMVA|nr:hypothetical protein EVAR_94140_1 [Eumeta japonica]
MVESVILEPEVAGFESYHGCVDRSVLNLSHAKKINSLLSSKCRSRHRSRISLVADSPPAPTGYTNFRLWLCPRGHRLTSLIFKIDLPYYRCQYRSPHALGFDFDPVFDFNPGLALNSALHPGSALDSDSAPLIRFNRKIKPSSDLLKHAYEQIDHRNRSSRLGGVQWQTHAERARSDLGSGPRHRVGGDVRSQPVLNPYWASVGGLKHLNLTI